MWIITRIIIISLNAFYFSSSHWNSLQIENNTENLIGESQVIKVSTVQCTVARVLVVMWHDTNKKRLIFFLWFYTNYINTDDTNRCYFGGR